MGLLDIEEVKLLAEVIGVLATLAMIISFGRKDDKELIIIHTISNALWGFHYFFLGAFSGVVFIFISVLRTFFVFRWDSHKQKVGFMIAMILFYSGYVLQETNLANLIPLLAVIPVSYGVLFCDKNKLTLLFILSNVIWLTYHLYIVSYAGTISSLMLISMLVYRFVVVKREQLKQKETATNSID